jgi:hypothetical protein
MRRRPGDVRPADGGESFQIMEPVTPVYLIPMPKPQRVVPLAGDPDWVLGDVIQPIEKSEDKAQGPMTPPAASPPL